MTDENTLINGGPIDTTPVFGSETPAQVVTYFKLTLSNINHRKTSLTQDEIMHFESTFQSIFPGKIRTIDVTSIQVKAHSFYVHKTNEVPKLEVILRVGGAYFPPPKLDFVNLALNEVESNLSVYENELRSRIDYLQSIQQVEVMTYIPKRPTISAEEQNQVIASIQKQQQEQLILEQQKKPSSHYHYVLEEDESLHRARNNVEIKYSAGGSMNYAKSYSYEGHEVSSTTSSNPAFSLALALLAVVFALIGIIAYRHQRKKQKLEVRKPLPGVRIPHDQIPYNPNTKISLAGPTKLPMTQQKPVKTKKNVRFSGLADYELGESKQISFQGVMDYEMTDSPHRQPYISTSSGRFTSSHSGIEV